MTARERVPCWHCGQPAVPGLRIRLPDADHPACCRGCVAAAEIIHGLGLADYYRFREQPAPTPDQDDPELSVFAMPELVEPFLVSDGDRHALTLMVDGIHCAACVWLIERVLRELPGMEQVMLALGSGRLQLRWRDDEVTPAGIARRLASLGYRPRLPLGDQHGQQRSRRLMLARLLVAGLGAMQSMMYAMALWLGAIDEMEPVYGHFFRIATLLVATPVIFFSGWPFLASAGRALRRGSLNMDVPVALALVSGWSGSLWATVSGGGHVWFESLAMFVFFLLIGRWLEQHQRVRVSERLERLQADMPLVVQQVDGERERAVPVSRLREGDVLRLRQGDVIPVDGEVVAGDALVQEAALTGEPVPLPRAVGAPVLAGSRLCQGWLEVRASGRPDTSRVARIGELVARAQQNRALPWPGLRRISTVFVGAVLVLAAATLAWHWSAGPALAFEHMLAVLVVTCPCALALATPLTMAAMVGRGLGAGVLIADPARFLRLGRVRTVIFDKTGTLTLGAFRVEDVVPLTPDTDEAVLRGVLAGLEQHASHPLALALRELAPPLPVTDVQVSRTGVRGVALGHAWRAGPAPVAAGERGTRIRLWRDDQPVLDVRLDDAVRPEAAQVADALRAHADRLVLASGDQPGAVAAVADRLGLDHWQAALTPEQKAEMVAALRRDGPVLMVGDGINDAPAFLAADAAVAVSGSTALARDASTAYLLQEGIDRLPWLFRLSHQARRVLYRNLAWALGYNMISVPFAMAGLVPPWLAAIGMSGSSLIVTWNAARLTRWPG